MKHLVVIGGGFAGVRAAQAAAATARAARRRLRVTLVAESERTTLRPRLYLAEPESWEAPLRPALEPLGIRLLLSRAGAIDAAQREVVMEGDISRLRYDAAIVATGSRLRWPAVPGLREAALDVDTYAGAARLLRHLSGLGSAPSDSIFAVVGAGFTGLEVATELRGTLARLHGPERAKSARILLIDRNAAAPDLGAQPRPAIEEALAAARIETRFGRNVAEAEPGALVLSDGERIAAGTIVYSGGLEARPLPIRPDLPRDALGRLVTDAFLRVDRVEGLFAAGDAAHAAVDEAGTLALMSCQHAIPMGDRAGRNAAAALLGLKLIPYRQTAYVTCLDLGESGALFSVGRDRQVVFTGEPAKEIKRAINAGIAPPSGSAEAMLRALDGIAASADDLPQRLARLGASGEAGRLAA